MKKLAIIVDSFSGRSKKQVESKDGFFFVPLRIIIDGEEYNDGIDEEQKKLLAATYTATDAKTSQPSPAVVIETMEKASKEFEQVIYMPTSGALSGTSRTAAVLAKEYENVHVIDNIHVGDTLIEAGEELQSLYESGKSIKNVLELGEKEAVKYNTYVVPANNDAIIRSGRLGRASAAILKKLKTVPIIGFEDTVKLHRKMIKRSGEKAVRWAIDKLMKDFPLEAKTQQWLICHNQEDSAVTIAKKILKEYGLLNVVSQLSAAMIAIHTGDGAISISIRKLRK